MLQHFWDILSSGYVWSIVLLDLLQVTNKLLETVPVDHQTRHAIRIIGNNVGCADVLPVGGFGVRCNVQHDEGLVSECCEDFFIWQNII